MPKITSTQAEQNILATGKVSTFICWLTKDGDYHGIHSRFQCRCNNGHIITKSYRSLVHSHKGCKTCGIASRAKKRMLPHAIAEEAILNRKVALILGWETDSGKYEGKDSIFRGKCLQNGHQFFQSYACHINHNHGCPDCNTSHKLSGDEVIQRINNSPKKIKFVRWATTTGKYQNSVLSRVILRCTQIDSHPTWEASYQTIFSKKPKSGACPICSGTIRRKRSKIQAKHELISKGVIGDFGYWDTASGEFENCNSYFVAYCKAKGHTIRQRFTSHVHGKTGCRSCAGNKKLSNKIALQNILSSQNTAIFLCWLTHSGSYENNQSRFLAICSQGHIFNQSYTAFMSQHECRTCGHNRIGVKKRTKPVVVERNIVDAGLVKYLICWNTPTGDYEGKDSSFTAIGHCGHVFTQTYANHIRGHLPCPCAKSGYNVHKPAYFYLCALISEGNVVAYKVGVTNNHFSLRIKKEERASIYVFHTVLTVRFRSGKKAKELESLIKSELKMFAVNSSDMPDGFTETFSTDQLSLCLGLIDSFH